MCERSGIVTEAVRFIPLGDSKSAELIKLTANALSISRNLGVAFGFSAVSLLLFTLLAYRKMKRHPLFVWTSSVFIGLCPLLAFCLLAASRSATVGLQRFAGNLKPFGDVSLGTVNIYWGLWLASTITSAVAVYLPGLFWICRRIRRWINQPPQMPSQSVYFKPDSGGANGEHFQKRRKPTF
jgi:hypothetical protein